ncbi:MAG TPA: tRNA guanosine(34) transglycosylase Tgt [Elusimicrobiota bacterium]|nr:tRNA guanosine(34) transglycosylase Tgt [Elusimicrobiota bacterium]
MPPHFNPLPLGRGQGEGNAVFSVLAQDSSSKARAGVLRTPRGEVPTPVFMPVATQASVKTVSQEDLKLLGVRAILANSYHLYLRPGLDTVKAAGGLHKFMGYDGMILTDSGGFQVLSQAGLRDIDDDGVSFRSHIDGSAHRLTPEKVIEIQSALGSDCWTTLDHCPPYPSSEKEAEAALGRTLRWTERSVPALNRARESGKECLFFPIAQGSFFPELRRRAAEHMGEIPADGVSIGGFSVGEPKDMTWDILSRTTEFLPKDKPRYLMGVGTPEDLWSAVACGIDMMDCVYPTRVARNGGVMTRRGQFNIGNSPFRKDFSALDPDCGCFVCAGYSRAYLSHLFRAKELAALRLLTFHNLQLMADVAAQIRRAIVEGRFTDERKRFLSVFRAAKS